MQSLKVRGLFGSLDFQTLLIHGKTKTKLKLKLLLSFIVRDSVRLFQESV